MLEVLDVAGKAVAKAGGGGRGQGHPRAPRKQPLQSSVPQPKVETADMAPPEAGGKKCGSGASGRRRGGRARGKAPGEQAAARASIAPPVVGPPVSSKGVAFCRRPGFGTVGARCVVKANHFLADLPDKDLTQYDVSGHSSPLAKKSRVHRGSAGVLVTPWRGVCFCRSRSRRR